MEVYATLFMIFVSHVLSSFTRTITSRQEDRRHIPQEKFRRIPIVYFQHQNNDDENQPDTAVGYIMPLLEQYRERIPNKESNRNISPNVEDMLLKSHISNARFHGDSRSHTTTRDHIFENHKKESYDDEDTKPLTVHQAKSRLYALLKKNQSNCLDLVTSNIENQNPSNEFLPTQVAEIACSTRGGRNLKPWKKFPFCGECNYNKKITVCNKEQSAAPCHTSEKQSCGLCTSGFFPFWKTTHNKGGPWLFYTGSRIHKAKAKRLAGTSRIVKTYEASMPKKYYQQYGSKITVNDNHISEVNQSNTKSLYYSTSANVFLDKTEIMKKRNCNIFQKKKQEDLKCKEGQEEMMFIQNGIVSNIGKPNLRKSNLGDRIRGKRSAAHVEFFPLGCFDKRANASKSIPSCQKSCFYNLTALVNARTIKPPAYYKQKRPSLVLCCQAKDDVTSNMKTLNTTNENVIDNSENQTSTTSNFTESASMNAELTTASMNAELTTAPLYKIYMQFRNATERSDKSVSTTSKEKFVLKLLTKNKDDLIDLYEGESEAGFHDLSFFLLEGNKGNKEKTMKTYIMKVRRRKKPKPWDKFCPCEGSSTCCNKIIGTVKHPWISTCCLESATSSEFVEEETTYVDIIGHTIAYTTRRKQLASTEKAHTHKEDRETEGTKSSSQAINKISTVGVPHKPSSKPDIKYMTAKKQELLNLLQGKTGDKDNLLVLVRVPVSVAKKYGNNGGLNLVLPVNNTLFTKYIKPRSIFDQLIPSILRKTTLPPRDHIMKPWEETCKLKKQEKFLLFSTHTPSFCAREVNRKNNFHFGKSTETGFIGLDAKELPDTCPSCGRRRYNLFSKTPNPNIPKYSITGEPGQTYEELGVDPSNNDVWKEECDDKYIPYLLDLPNKEEIESSSPMIPKISHTTIKAWRLIQKYDNPLKYYIEVPETFGEVIKKSAVTDDVQGVPYIPENALNKIFSQNQIEPEKLLLKPISHKKSVLLYLQPYELNGHKVYLPISGLKQPRRGNMVQSLLENNEDLDDDKESNDNFSKSRSQAVKNLIYKNDSVVPFALIPAYLTFHPHNKFNYEFNIQPKGNKNETFQIDSVIPQPENSELHNLPHEDKDHESKLIPEAVPIENKWLKLAQQIENTLQNPLPHVKLSSARNHASSRKPVTKKVNSGKPHPPYLDKPTYIILMKEMGDIAPILESDLTFVENDKLSDKADDFTIVECKGDLAKIGGMDKSHVLN